MIYIIMIIRKLFAIKFLTPFKDIVEEIRSYDSAYIELFLRVVASPTMNSNNLFLGKHWGTALPMRSAEGIANDASLFSKSLDDIFSRKTVLLQSEVCVFNVGNVEVVIVEITTLLFIVGWIAAYVELLLCVLHQARFAG